MSLFYFVIKILLYGDNYKTSENLINDMCLGAVHINIFTSAQQKMLIL